MNLRGWKDLEYENAQLKARVNELWPRIQELEPKCSKLEIERDQLKAQLKPTIELLDSVVGYLMYLQGEQVGQYYKPLRDERTRLKALVEKAKQ